MPNAISGEEDGNGYTFAVDAPLEEVKIYYNRALIKLGWDLFATGQEEGKSELMFYQKDS